MYKDCITFDVIRAHSNKKMGDNTPQHFNTISSFDCAGELFTVSKQFEALLEYQCRAQAMDKPLKDYRAIFQVVPESFISGAMSFEQLPSNIGTVTVSVDPVELLKQCKNNIKLDDEKYIVTIQHPENGRQLNEWTSCFSNYKEFEALKDSNDHSFGFCLLNSLDGQVENPSKMMRTEELFNLAAPSMERSNINTLYIMSPFGVNEQIYMKDGKTIRIVPASQHQLTDMTQRLSDEDNIINDQFQVQLFAQNGPISDQSVERRTSSDGLDSTQLDAMTSEAAQKFMEIITQTSQSIAGGNVLPDSNLFSLNFKNYIPIGI